MDLIYVKAHKAVSALWTVLFATYTLLYTFAVILVIDILHKVFEWIGL